jgi:hypothetical protein
MAGHMGPAGSSPPSPLGSGPGMPGWLAPVVQLTAWLGVPTMFAGILLWFVLTQVGSAMTTIQRAEDERIKAVLAMQQALVSTIERQSERFEKAIEENIQVNRELAERYHGGRAREQTR